MAEGEQVHISTYPPIWPTRPPAESGAYDIRRAIEIRAGAHAFEAKVFNIVSSNFLDEATKRAVAKDDKALVDIMERSPRSVSMIIGPDGGIIGDVISEEEGIVYADIDTSLEVEPKQFHDVVGYYNRFDIYSLRIDRSRREPALFVEGELEGEPERRPAASRDPGEPVASVTPFPAERIPR
jgi:aliphatic nitrilase